MFAFNSSNILDLKQITIAAATTAAMMSDYPTTDDHHHQQHQQQSSYSSSTTPTSISSSLSSSTTTATNTATTISMSPAAITRPGTATASSVRTKRCCRFCRCSNRLVTGIIITILPIAITSTLICVFMMQKTNLHQYAIYSFVIFCVAFVFPFALFFFTVILNKLYKFYKREIRSNSSHSSSLNVNALIGDSYDSDAHFHHLHSHPHTHHPHHHQAHLSNVLDCDGNQLTNSSPSSIRLLTSNHPISANENIGLIANASVNANHSSFNRPTNVLGTRIIVAHNPVFDHHFHHHLQNHHNYLNENHAVSNVLGDDVQYNQQQAQLFSYNNQSYHPSYYYQIQDGSTLIALTTANSATNDGPISFSNRLPATEMIVEDNPPSYEMALLCPSVTHNCNQDDSFSRTDGVCQQQSFHCLPKYQISFPDNSVKEEKIKIGLNQIGPESIVNHLDDNNTTLNDQNRRENLCDQKPSQDVQSNETTSVRNNKNADDVDVNVDEDDEENEKKRSSSPSSSFNLNQNNNLDRKE